VDFASLVKVIESVEKLATYDGDLCFMEGSWFDLLSHQPCLLLLAVAGHTKSKQDPPPRYSMTIHSLMPLTKLALYCVT
jgi:hypothetical protein